jgi:hypothetical protein
MRLLARRARVALVVPALVVATAGCDIVTADLRHSESAEWRKSYQLQPGGRVSIGNVNGKVEVRPSDGNTVEIVAVKTARGVTPEAARQALDRIEIQEQASPENIAIETKVPRGGWRESGGAQVAYTIRVPSGIVGRFATVNGGVEVNGVGGRITAETTNGGVTVRDGAGTIEAITTNGGVNVDMRELSGDGARLECTNGGIQLRLPASARASISASVTNGGIETSGLELETLESTRRRLEARLNGGGAPVKISGTNGGIRISAH